MRASNGFDRMSTPEELHQVLAVLRDIPGADSGENEADEQAATLVAGAQDPDATAESLADFLMNNPELKN